MAKYADMPSTEFRVQHGALGVRVSAIVRFAEDELKSPCNFYYYFFILFFIVAVSHSKVKTSSNVYFPM